MANVDFSVASMAQSIASGLLAYVSPPRGALIIGEVFPPQGTPPVYFDKVYDQLTKIMQQTITPDDATAISGALNDVQTWVTGTYVPLKANPSSTPSILQEAVKPFVDTIVSGAVMPLLAAGPAGLSIFLLAAGVHLALVQELAYTDPANQTDGGAGSPFAASVKQYAQEYHDFIGTTWAELETTRKNWCSVTLTAPTWPTFMVNPGYATWTDGLDGTSGVVNATTQDPYPADAAAPAAWQQVAAHVTVAMAGLATSLGDLDTIAANFLQLVSYPIPAPNPEILALSASGGGSVNYDQGYQQKTWSYSLSWNTTGGTASFDGGVGPVAPSGTLSFNQQNSPPTLPSTLTVTGPYANTVRQITW